MDANGERKEQGWRWDKKLTQWCGSRAKESFKTVCLKVAAASANQGGGLCEVYISRYVLINDTGAVFSLEYDDVFAFYSGLCPDIL